MQFLHRLDEGAKACYPNWNCSVLGASVVFFGKNGCGVNNYASQSPNWRFSTKHFGECYAVGSGAQELREFIETADRNLDAFGKIPPDFFWKLVGALNGKALFQQNEAVHGQTWGGLLQVHAFEPNSGIWARTPPWLHIGLIYEGKRLNFKGFHPKTVFHVSQDRNTSAVITTVTFPDGKTDTVIWPVYPLQEFNNKDRALHLTDLAQVPEFVTITVDIIADDNSKFCHCTFPTDYVAGLSFVAAPRGDDAIHLKCRLESDVLSSWLRDVLLNDTSFLRLISDIPG